MRPAPPRVVVTRVVRASRDRVFHAWTDPTALSRWFHPVGFTSPAAEADVRVGGTFRVGMKPPEGNAIYASGTYVEIEPPSRLAFTWQWEGTEYDQLGETLVTLDFHEVSDGTEIRLQHEQIPDEAARRQHAEGWNSCLESLTRWLDHASATAG